VPLARLARLDEFDIQPDSASCCWGQSDAEA
jgi:hypothetical protein